MKIQPTLLLILISFKLLSQDVIQIGFSLGEFNSEQWSQDCRYFEEAAKTYGAKVLFEYGYGDVDQQILQCKNLIDSGIQVLVIMPTDVRRFSSVIDYAHEKGVSVISYDRLILDANPDLYISFDNEKIGELQASYAVQQKPEGNYILLTGPETDFNSELYLRGQKKVLQPYVDQGKINILKEVHLPAWNAIAAFNEIQDLIDSVNTIDAIIASDDQIATGSITSLDFKLKEWNILITGQDGNSDAIENILAEKQAMTLYKPVNQLAELTVRFAVDLVNGSRNGFLTNSTMNNGKENVPAMLIDPFLVDSRTLKEKLPVDKIIVRRKGMGI